MEGVPREAEEPREGGHDRARRQVHPPERFVHQPHRGVPPCGRPRPRAREPQVGGVTRHREARDEGARGIGRHPRAGRVRGSGDRGEDRRYQIRGGEGHPVPGRLPGVPARDGRLRSGGPSPQGPALLRRVSIPSGVAIPSAAAFANPLGPRSRRRVLSPQPLNRPWASSCFVSTFSYDQLLTRAKKALPAALSSGERFQVPAPDVVIESKVTAQQLEERIKSYVDAYVLCQECGRPDTRLVKEDRIAMLECDACGARRPVKAVKKGAIVKVFIEKIAGTVAFGRVTRE